MPMRSSSLANNPLAITRELDGRYDVVLEVRDNLDLITQVSGIDFAAILAELESAQDFTGITVEQGTVVAWDAVNKILTVPKGDKGDKGDTGLTGPQGAQGIQGSQGIKGDTGLKGDTGSQGPKGFDGAAGAQGLKGDTGDDLTISQITYNGNGTFNWLFSDGTVYVTPSLKGPKGDTGNQGVKGDQGISVHHIKGTSTTDDEGDFGAYSEIDTYTVYGDANETINLGFFRVNNGAAKEGQHSLMYKSTYDITANGIVDNSEKLEGRTIAQIQADITDTIGASNGIASLDATTKLERAQVPTMNVTLEGDVSGSFAVDGSLNTTVNVVVQDNSHSHTFSNLTANPTTLSGYGITDAATSDHNHSDATTSVSGFMSTSDKIKLDTIAPSSNNYVHPSTHDASMITTTDEFSNSDSINVQDVLDDLDYAIDVEKGRIDAILIGAGANADTFAEVVTLVNSIDTTNDQAFAGYVLSNDDRSATIEGDISALESNKADKATTLSGYGIVDAYTKTELDGVNVLRADKFLAAQNIAAMVYTAGDLTKIQYNNASDVNYEVLNYTSENLLSINHYIASVLRGTTTLSYSGGNMISAIFVGV